MTSPTWVVLATLITVATAGPLLRWCPTPLKADAPFSNLVTPGFRIRLGLTTLVVASLVAWAVPQPWWPTWAGLVLLGPLLGWVDHRTQFLPKRLTWLGTALALVGVGITSWWLGSWLPVLWAVVGGLGATGFFWLMWWLGRGQLGFGDVRLAGFIGVSIGGHGPTLLWVALFLGSLVGVGWGIALRLREGVPKPFPYGPALLVGVLLALLLSPVLPG